METNIPLFPEKNIAKTELAIKEKGLSELVRMCFGKPLNKSEQISNWEKRPFRKTQLTYVGMQFSDRIKCSIILLSSGTLFFDSNLQRLVRFLT